MNCPKCKKPLLIVERNNIEVDYCPICNGFWLDKGELDLLVEIFDIDTKMMDPFGRPFIKTKEDIYKCPKCSNNMGKVKMNDVILDICPEAEGIWFDANELSKILLNQGKTLNEDKLISFLGENFYTK